MSEGKVRDHLGGKIVLWTLLIVLFHCVASGITHICTVNMEEHCPDSTEQVGAV